MFTYFTNDASKRIRWLHIFVSFGFLLGIGLSFPLWAGERIFPYIPLFQQLNVSGSVHWLTTILLCLALMMNIIFFKKYWTKALLFIILFSVMIDQMRLQPWVYIYITPSLAGHDFTLSVLASDCQPTAHWGYVYLDGFGAVTPPTNVPEPGSLSLLGLGMVGLLAAACRRRKTA